MILGGSLFTRAAFGAPHCLDLHAQSCFTFVFISSNPKRNVPRRWRQRDVCRVEVNCASMIITLTKPQNDVLFLYLVWRRNRPDFAREKKRRGISATEGLKHFVPLEKISIEFRKRQLVVDVEATLQALVREQLARHPQKFPCEHVDFFFANGKACRHFVSAKFLQDSAATLQGFNEI